MYHYDALSRFSSGTAGSGNSQVYTYDPYGNRKTATTTGATCVGGCGLAVVTYDDRNHITSNGAAYDASGT